MNQFPRTGDTLYGFEVLETGEIHMLGARTALWKHRKSGAHLLLIQNADINRSFTVAYRTPVTDSKGKPHILEHSCLNGSGLFPDPNLFFRIAHGTYNTYINALTADHYTAYPMASLSDEQLLALVDYYMDGTLDPQVLRDERVFMREAWRKEMEDEQSPLVLTGTVLNEMKGSLTLEAAGERAGLNALFPGASLDCVAGGDPEQIADLTWKELCDYHRRWYRPSNSLILLYGKTDYPRYLEKLDRDFLGTRDCETAVLPSRTGRIEPGFPRVRCSFPVEAGSETQGRSFVQYAFAVPEGQTPDEEIHLQILASVLAHEASPFGQRMRDLLPGATPDVLYQFTRAGSAMLFQAEHVDEGDEETFRQAVDQAIGEIREHGLDPELVEAVVSEKRFTHLLLSEADDLGVSVSVALASRWANGRTLDIFDRMDRVLSEMNDAESFRKAACDALASCHRRSLALAVPAPGESEKRELAVKQALEAEKKSMTRQQIRRLVRRTREFSAWSAEEADAAQWQRFRVLRPDNLPEEVMSCPVHEDVVENTRFIDAESATSGLIYNRMMLPISGIDPQDLGYLTIHCLLAGSLPTRSMTREEVATKITHLLNAFSLRDGCTILKDKTPYFHTTVQWINLEGESEAARRLAWEILFETDYTVDGTLLSMLGNLKSRTRASAEDAPYRVLMTRAMAVENPKFRYRLPGKGPGFYEFLTRVLRQARETPEAFTAKMRGIVGRLRTRNGLVAMRAGDRRSLESDTQALRAFVAALPNPPAAPLDFSGIALPKHREGLKMESKVAYNLLFAPLEKLGLVDDGALRPLKLWLTAAYLTPKLRQAHGAYDIICEFDEDGILLISYRDPEIRETFRIYEEMGAWMRGQNIEPEALRDYILSAYSDLAQPSGPLTLALNDAVGVLDGDDAQKRLREMREVKAFTPERIRRYAEAFDRLSKVGVRSTAASAAAIDENRDLYDAILCPFGKEEARPEDS